MKAICYNYSAQNEYTQPLSGKPYYRNSGIIYAVDRRQNKYAVARIDYERFDDQNYQYVFSPEWSVIDTMPSSIFQGIPGIDMSLRLEKYYRVNMTPYFISERTPSEAREDLWELLESVGLDYYDRFEWLLRTNMRCGTDNLIVERSVSARNIHIAEESALVDLQPNDVVVIDDFRQIASTSNRLRQKLLNVLRSGAHIYLAAENRVLTEDECNLLLQLIMAQYELDVLNQKHERQQGIEKAQRDGKYSGRKRICVDEHLLQRIAKDFEEQRISESEAMKRAGIFSRSTFYRRLRELRKQDGKRQTDSSL